MPEETYDIAFAAGVAGVMRVQVEAVSELTEVLSEISQVAGVVSDVASAVGGVFGVIVTVLEKLNILRNEFDVLNEKIDFLIKRIEDLEKLVEDSIGVSIRINAGTTLAVLNGAIKSMIDAADDYRNTADDDSLLPEKRRILVDSIREARGSIFAILARAPENDFWKQLYVERNYYRQWDESIAIPPHSSREVFTYRAALIRAIDWLTRYTVSSLVLEPDIGKFRRQYGNELEDWVNSLHRVHDRIVDQLKIIKVPRREDVYAWGWQRYRDGAGNELPDYGLPLTLNDYYAGIVVDTNGNLTGTKWHENERIIGYVEYYSGYAVEKKWPKLKPKERFEGGPTHYRLNPYPLPDQFLRDFYSHHALEVLRARKDLYVAVGLAQLMKFVNHTRSIIGLAAIPPHPYNYISLREIDRAVALKSDRASTAAAGEMISLRAIAQELGVSAPFSFIKGALPERV